MPPGVVLAVSRHTDARGAGLVLLEPLQRLAYLALDADDADKRLHRLLQISLQRVRVLAVAAAFERLERHPFGPGNGRFVQPRLALFARPRRRVFTGPLPEYDQVGQGVAPEAVGAVDAGCAFARGEQPGNGGHLAVAVHANPTHDVVGGGTNLHRLLRDVEVRELHELVIHARQFALDVLLGVRQLLLDPGNIQKHTAVRRAAPCLHLAHDAAGHVVARQQLRRTPGRLVVLHVPPPFLGVGSRLRPVVLRDVVEHEPAAFAVLQHAALAAHTLGDQQPFHAQRPDHAGRMELHEFHVNQIGPGAVRQRVAVPGALPAVARHFVRAPDAAGGQNDRFRGKHVEAAALAIVDKGAGRSTAVQDQIDDGVLHMHGHTQVNGVVLERANQLEAGAIADVRQTRIAVAAEVALVDAPIRRAIEHGAPRLELAHAVGRFLGMELRHPPVVDILAAAHRVGEMHLPVVAIVVVAHGRGHAALGHDRVRLAQQRLADEAHGGAGVGRLDRRSQARTTRPDDQDVVGVRRMCHQRILRSVQIPIEQSRT